MNVLRKTLQALAAAAEQSAPAKGPWLPVFHLTPPTGWLNDPNGLCRFRGEYHVFYQYAPFEADCGLKFWGHYTSPDLVNWKQRPVMLCPDQTFDLHGVYSGSALCEEDGLYLYYTGNVKHEGGFDYVLSGRESNTVLAFSPDGQRIEWKRPLMRNGDYPAGLTLHVRDPKVWKRDGMYYMAQGARTRENEGAALIFESADKFQWRHINTLRAPEPFGYMWECPDVFEMDGRWFLLACPQGPRSREPGLQNRYACGYFPIAGDFRDSRGLGKFVPLDYGFDFYAPQTFSDGARRLLIGWMGMPDADYTNPTAAYGWQHCLSVPRELFLKDGKLCTRPVQELEALREEGREYGFSGRRTVALPAASDISLTWEGDLSLELSGVSLRAEGGSLTLTALEGGYGRESRTAPISGPGSLRVLADTSALEFFVNGGETVLSLRWYPEGGERTLALSGRGRALIYGLRPMGVERPPRGMA